MHVRRLLLAAVLLSTAPAAIFGQIAWTRVASFSDRISVVRFLEPRTGFVAIGTVPGSPGVVPAMFKTTDGGTTWQQCTVNGLSGGFGIQDFFMDDSLRGFACGGSDDGFSIWKTVDGGLNWSTVGPSDGRYSVSIQRTNAGILVSDFHNGHLRCSSDGGISFNDCFSPPASDNLLGMDFSDSVHGMLVSSFRSNNPWMFTSDGGRSWQPSNENMESWSVYCQKGTSNCYASPEGWSNGPFQTSILRSTDYGKTWQPVHQFAERMTGHMCGGEGALYIQGLVNQSNGSLFRSIDSGLSWTRIGGPAGINDTRFFTVSLDCQRRAIYVGGSDNVLYLGIDTSGGGAFTTQLATTTRSQPTAERAVGDTAGIDLDVSFPSGSAVIGVVAETVTLTIEHNPNVTGIAFFGDGVIPAPGWLPRSIALSGKQITIVFADTGDVAIGQRMHFGTMVLTVETYPKAPTSIVRLDSLTIVTACRVYTATPDIESGQLRTIVVKTAGVASVPTASDELSIYPDPVADVLTFRCPPIASREATVTVFDMAGRTIVRSTIHPNGAAEHQLDCRSLAEGTYVLQIVADHTVIAPFTVRR